MNIIDFAVKFFQDSGLAIYPSILIMAIGMAIAVGSPGTELEFAL